MGPSIDPSGTTDPDELFGRQLISQGLVTPEQVRECMEIRDTLARTGVTPIPRLADCLVRRGYLTPDEGAKTVRLAEGPTAVENPKGPPVERRIGRYVLEGRLGAGGMGEVWRARDPDLGRPVAIKLLGLEKTEDLARFRREAQVLAGLNHPNIAAVYEVGEDRGRPFIAMQFIDGRTLTSFPRTDRRLMVELVRDAALAVHAAHEHGIVHRDLKPANLMVDASAKAHDSRSLPGKPRIYILDFGLAKQTALGSALSVSGTVLGTPSYMPPEQASGHAHEADARSDVYSLGATLYELLTNRPPFPGSDVYAVLKRVVEEDPPPVRALAPAADRELEVLVMKCLEKEPERRYRSALELAEDLTRYLEGEPISAHATSPFYRWSKKIGKRKAVYLSALAGVLSVGVLALVLVPRWQRERRDRRAKERELTAERERAWRLQEEARLQIEALRELGGLWMQIVATRRDLCSPSEDPHRVFRDIRSTIVRIDEYVSRQPNQPQAYYVRARGRLYLYDLEGAAADLNAALRIDPRFDPGRVLLARVRLEQHRLRLVGDRSMREEHVLRARPLLEEARALLAEAGNGAEERISVQRWGLPRAREDKVVETLARAMAAYCAGADSERAREILGEAEPELRSEEIRNFLGFLAPTIEERIRWQTAALEVLPHYPQAFFDRGVARWVNAEQLHAAGRTAEAAAEREAAIADYTRVLDLHPAFAWAHIARGTARESAGDLEEGITDYTRAIRSDPKLAEAHAALGIARQRQGRVLEASGKSPDAEQDASIEDLTRALNLEPVYAMAYSSRCVSRTDRAERLKLSGRADDAAQEFELAVRDASRAIELSPRFAGAFLNRGIAKESAGDRIGALRDFDQAIELNPVLIAARFHRAGIYQSSGDLAPAIEEYGHVLRLEPRYAAALSARGSARRLAARGRPLEEATALRKLALEDCTRGIEIDPSAKAFGGRGAVRHESGDLVGAVEDYSRSVEINPRYPDAYAARAVVRDSLASLDPGRAADHLAKAVGDLEKALEVAPAGWPHREWVRTTLSRVRAAWERTRP